MTALRGIAGELAVAVLALALAGACSRDNKTLLLVNVSLQAGAPAPETASLEVGAGGTSIGSADFVWSPNENGILVAGVFLPDGVSGPVIVTAKGTTGGVTIATDSGEATIEAAKTNGPIALVLKVITGALGDGGADGASIDDGGGEDVTDAEGAPNIGDGGVPDGRGGDRIVVDGARAESAPHVDGDGPLVDGGVGFNDDGGLDIPVGDRAGLDASTIESGSDRLAVDAPPDGDARSEADDSGDGSQSLSWRPASTIENDPAAPSCETGIAVEPFTENVYVTWNEATAVKVKRWDRQTGTWGPTGTLQNGGNPYEVRVGTDAAGHIIAAWNQDYRGPDASLAGIWVSKSSDGTFWSPPEQVVAGTVLDLQLGVARNGVARMAFSRQTDTNKTGLFTAIYDRSSWTVSPDPVLPPDSPHVSYSSNPQLAISANGDGIVVFEEYDDSMKTSVGVVNLTGPTRSAPQILDTDTTNNIYYTDRYVAMNGNGEGAVVWSQTGPSLYLSTYQSSVGWSTPQKLADTNGFDNLGLAIDDEDFVTVAWVQSLSVSGYNVMAMHGGVNGTWSAITPLETDNQASWMNINDFALPTLAVDVAGNVLAVWKKKVNSTTFGAYARRLQGDTWQPQVKLGEKTGLQAYRPVVAVADSGFGVAAFTFIDPTGTSTDPEAYNVEVAFCR